MSKGCEEPARRLNNTQKARLQFFLSSPDRMIETMELFLLIFGQKRDFARYRDRSKHGKALIYRCF